MRTVVAAAALAWRCAMRQLGWTLAVRVAAVLAIAAIPWALAGRVTAGERVGVDAALLALSALALSGLATQFARRHAALRPWLATLPAPSASWWCGDLLALLGAGLAAAVPLLAGALAVQGLSWIGAGVFLLAFLLLLAALGWMAASVAALSLAWSVLACAVWGVLVAGAVERLAA